MLGIRAKNHLSFIPTTTFFHISAMISLTVLYMDNVYHNNIFRGIVAVSVVVSKGLEEKIINIFISC